MRDYFGTWRRRFGVAALALACVFAAGWMRGLVIQDSFLFGNGQGIITRGTVMVWLSASARDGFVWSKNRMRGNSTWLAGWKAHPIARGYLLDPTDSGSVESMQVEEFRARLLGFEIARYHGYTQYGEDETFSFWRIKHWSIVTPLTILSTWLLLSKRRDSKPTNPPESV